MQGQIPPRRHQTCRPTALGRQRRLPRLRRRVQAQVLLPVDVPLPSGKLHMGHVRNYTIGDVLSRFHKMKGFNVLQPMGWDAFRPARRERRDQESGAAAKMDLPTTSPHEATLSRSAFAIDWSRELATCTPEYYRWNQWIFLRMLERASPSARPRWSTGIRSTRPCSPTSRSSTAAAGAPARWSKARDPLATTSRSPTTPTSCWATSTTLGGWPERVKLMQANWIGKSTGVRFAFKHDIAG